jgi:hypothetical protein
VLTLGSVDDVATFSADASFKWPDVKYTADELERLQTIVSSTALVGPFLAMAGGFKFEALLNVDMICPGSIHADLTLPLQIALVLPKLILIASCIDRCQGR